VCKPVQSVHCKPLAFVMQTPRPVTGCPCSWHGKARQHRTAAQRPARMLQHLRRTLGPLSGLCRLTCVLRSPTQSPPARKPNSMHRLPSAFGLQCRTTEHSACATTCTPQAGWKSRWLGRAAAMSAVGGSCLCGWQHAPARLCAVFRRWVADQERPSASCNHSGSDYYCTGWMPVLEGEQKAREVACQPGDACWIGGQMVRSARNPGAASTKPKALSWRAGRQRAPKAGVLV
jgi:hypothetical protein